MVVAVGAGMVVVSLLPIVVVVVVPLISAVFKMDIWNKGTTMVMDLLLSHIAVTNLIGKKFSHTKRRT